ncbi:hypothetical protein LIER_21297 [Lithospermum erythrorhizon]|uniref:Integrase catalytic domain-containing protein n=1 Tax=Lithospermum erythrorhizon TaxID=34254 RepID=A0AAV3QPU5_LITER
MVITRVLEMMHMHLMGPMQVESNGTKNIQEADYPTAERKGATCCPNQEGKEFENSKFSEFCANEGITHEFSSPIIPQQNGVVERKNHTIQEMAHVMLHAKNIPLKFRAEAIKMECHIHNQISLRPGIFLGYSRNGRALHVFNKIIKVVMESINVKVLDQRLKIEEDVEVRTPVINSNPGSTGSVTDDEPCVNNSCDNISSIQSASRIQKRHPTDNIIGQLDQGITKRRKEPIDYLKMVGLIGECSFISKVEPKNIDEALKDEHWIRAMQEELLQFQRNDVWKLVPRPKDHNLIGTK